MGLFLITEASLARGFTLATTKSVGGTYQSAVRFIYRAIKLMEVVAIALVARDIGGHAELSATNLAFYGESAANFSNSANLSTLNFQNPDETKGVADWW